jgi:Obg family GTPase CgtA
MSRASPEVAPYPFTTRHPLLGVLEFRDGARIRVADIPGLIDGAAQGRGCGHDFLRHVERTKALLYMVDAAGTDFRDPIQDLRVLVNELESYGDGSLLEQRALVVANKVDLMEKEKIQEVLGQLAEVADSLGIHRDHDVMAISAGVTGFGLGPLSQAIRKTVELSEMDRQEAFHTTSKAI